MILIRSCLVAAALLMVITAHAADAITIFGLPLGGKLESKTKLCPINADKAKDLCWIDRPSVVDGGVRIGYIHLPNPDGRPAWAAYAMFRATMSKDGELNVLEARTSSAKDKNIIAKSIESRFGLPAESTLAHSGIASATWTGAGAHIYMICSDDDFCSVEFRSMKSQRGLEREITVRRQKDAARPVSP